MRRGEDEIRERIVLLYDRYLPVVYGFARNRLQAADAEDVAAEVFRTALQKLRAEPDVELTKAWFLTVTRNLVIDRWRRDLRWEGRLQVASTPGGPIFGPIFRTENAGSATLYGAEAELLFQATPNDLISANLQYLHTKYDELDYQFYSTTGAPPVLGCPTSITTQTGASPQWQAVRR